MWCSNQTLAGPLFIVLARVTAVGALVACAAAPAPPAALPRAPAAPSRAPRGPVEAGVGMEARPVNRTCVAPEPPPRTARIQLTPMFGEQRFDQAVAMVQAPGDTDHWYIAERRGRVLRAAITGGEPAGVVADLTDIVYSAPGDAGLLGLAFHPRFQSERTVFLSYTVRRQRKQLSHVLRYRLDGDGALDRGSGQVLIELPQPGPNHNGGHVLFGPDGYLYVGFGDGQLGADPDNYSQRLDTLLGKILRIDVNAGEPYAVPPDNPFVGGEGRPEIWAYGLRNPWRFSFDSVTGELWAGDVGQADAEEIDRVVKGGNYGWSARQGSRCYLRRRGCDRPEYIDPVTEYDHTQGMAVAGGYVYRGWRLFPLLGAYLFGDFGSGRIWSLVRDPVTHKYERTLLLRSGLHISSFAEDRSGELYVLDYQKGGGAAYRLDPDEDEARESTFPEKLSETGCVDASDPTQPAEGLIAYQPTRAAWSDGAEKEQWLALPEGARVEVGSDGHWALPVGAVVHQRFRVDGALVESRLLIHHRDRFWGGYSYAWNEDGTDAELLEDGDVRQIGQTTWVFPNRAQCSMCHSAAGGFTLGLDQRLLDREVLYPGRGTASQVDTFAHIGLFGSEAPRPRPFPLAGAGGDVARRARAYLHTNCSPCHQPGGVTQGAFDMRAETPLARTGICEAAPKIPVPGFETARVVSPGNPEASVLLERMRRVDQFRMPMAGTSVVDQDGVALIRAWIAGLASCPPGGPE